MKTMSIIVCLIMSFAIISPVSANDAEFARFLSELTKQFGNQRPDVMVETSGEVIIIFALVKTMKQFNFNKVTGKHKVKEIRRFEDSTKSPFHMEPYQRLKEAVAIYGSD